MSRFIDGAIATWSTPHYENTILDWGWLLLENTKSGYDVERIILLNLLGLMHARK
jgi:hypothetical protein